LILAAVSLCLAIVPHLFYVKYRDHVQKTFQNNLKMLETEESSVKNEISNFQTLQSELKSLEELESKVVQRLNVVKKLQASRKGPVNLLDSVGQLLPQRVWLTKIELNFDANSSLQLTGNGYSSEDVAEFVDKLNTSVYFQKVNLDSVSSQKEGEQQGSVKSFFVFAVPKVFE
jgi:type IV pilus assembly protein PilN